jgi:AsmA protein
MRRILYTVAALVALTIIVIGALVAFPPVGLIRDRALHTLGQATGYHIATAGSLTLSLLPEIVMQLDDVTLANPETKERAFFQVRQIKAEAGWLPLLSWTLHIHRLTFHEPRVSAIVDKEGVNSWSPTGKASPTAGAPRVRFGALRVEGGEFIFSDMRSGIRVQLEQVNAETEQVSLDGPSTVAFDFVVNGEKVQGKGTIQAPSGLTAGAKTPVTLLLSSARGELRFQGDFPLAEPVLAGGVRASGPSLRSVAKWLGSEPPTSDGWGKFALDAHMRAQASRVDITEIRAVLDTTRAEGNLKVDASAATPLISGALSVDRLDVRTYVGDTKQTHVSVPESVSPESVEILSVPIKESLEAYLKGVDTSPTLEALERTSGSDWSDREIDMSALRSAKVDLDMDLKINELNYGPIALGRTDLRTALRSGRLDLQIKQLILRDGSVSGTVVMDTRPRVSTVEAAIDIDGVEAGQFLSDIGAPVVVSGKAVGQVRLKATGGSQKALMRSISGTAHANVRSGAVQGYDIRRMVTRFWQKQIFNLSNRTPFDRAEVMLNLRDGVANNSSLVLIGPSVGIKAEGLLHLAARQLDYQTKLSLPPPDDFWVSMRIFGSWFKTRVAVDWGSFFANWTRIPTLESVAGEPELKDPELADLVKRAIAKQGPGRELDPRAAAILREMNQKAQ